MIILGIELLLIIVGIILGYKHGVYLAILGYLVGFLLPFALYKKFDAQKVNFPHLVERVSLIVIIVFGEAIVNLASYFNIKTPLAYAVLLFIALSLMVANYVLFSEKIINHHQISRGFMLMYTHIVIVVAVLLLTVGTIYLNIANINVNSLALMLIASTGIYYVALLLNAVYDKMSCLFELKDIAIVLLIFVFAAIVIWVVRATPIYLMITLLVLNLAIFGFLVLKIADAKA